MPRLLIRACRALAAIAILTSLTACFMGDRAMAPLPDKARSELAAAGLELGAPVYIRLFKLEAEMEVWLQNKQGTYTLFRTYPICNYSGDLGPKTTEGDKQAPEGFYAVTSAQLNPKSKYYLSFNIGYPNAYDRSKGYTGSNLMVHGGCLSVGCYAMTDESIQELYILAREAFNNGQREFPVHAFPFRMTAENFATHKDSEWLDFWKNLKQGDDAFQMSHVPPVVGVKNGRYVFFANASKVPGEYLVASSDPRGPQLIKGWDQ